MKRTWVKYKLQEEDQPPRLANSGQRDNARVPNAVREDDVGEWPPWPEPLAPEAFHGLAGEIVRTIEPHSEADPAAILIQLLVAFGNAVGRGPHFKAEADCHYTNIFTVLVGNTSKGRKGTAWGHVRSLFEQLDSEWAGRRIHGGLTSGEGLIWSVRDEGDN